MDMHCVNCDCLIDEGEEIFIDEDGPYCFDCAIDLVLGE